MSDQPTPTAFFVRRLLRQLDPPKAIELPAEERIEPDGVNQIVTLLRASGIELYPHQWNWDWTAEHELKGVKYQGNLTTRLSKLYKIRRKVKMPPDLLEQVGNLAGRYKTKAKPLLVGYTEQLDWNAGAYGDRNSCFCSYAGPGVYRKAMMDAGWGAVTISKEQNGEVKGVARMWLAPDQPSPGMLVLTNPYGLRSLDIAVALGQVLGGFGHYPVRVSNSPHAPKIRILYYHEQAYLLAPAEQAEAAMQIDQVVLQDSPAMMDPPEPKE